jgi:hypothetical protein
MANDPYSPDARTQPYQQGYGNEGYYAPNDETARSIDANGAQIRSQRQQYVDPAGNQVERRVETVEDKNAARANARYWIRAITYFLLSVLEVILLLRFIFRLLGANQGNAFITFLYNLSHVFVAPFNGIFNDQTIGNASVFEVSTIIAALVYALIAWGIVSLGRVLFSPVLDSEQSVSTTRRRRR